MAVCLCALTFSGCSGSGAGNTSASSGSGSGTSSAASPSGKGASGKLTVWSWNYECGNFQGEIDNTKITQKYQQYFKKYYPNIEADFEFVSNSDFYTKLKVALAGGAGPDITGMQAGANFSQFKPFLKPLATYAQRDWGSDWRDKFSNGSFIQIDPLGKEIYGLPACLTYAGTVFYSQKILDKYGLKAPQTWDDLENTAKALRAHNALPLVTGAKDNWTNEDMFMTLATELGSDKVYHAVEGKEKWTDPDIVKALTYFQKLFTDKIFQDGALGVNMYNEAYSLWDDSNGNCKAAMQPNGSWAINAFAAGSQNYDNFVSWNRNVELFPSIDGKSGKLLVTPDAIWCMTTNTNNPEAAWAFIRWSVAEEGQQAMADGYAGFPVWKGIHPKSAMSPSLKTVYNEYEQWISEGKVIGYRQIPYPDLLTAIDNNLQLLATSQSTPEKAAAAIEKASEAQQR